MFLSSLILVSIIASLDDHLGVVALLLDRGAAKIDATGKVIRWQ